MPHIQPTATVSMRSALKGTPLLCLAPRRCSRTSAVAQLPAHAGARGKEPNPPQREREKAREVYKYFDEAVITVKAGNGGDGENKRSTKPKQVKNFKYQPGRQQPKFIDLPAAEPADGAKGSDVLLYVDLEYDSLLHLRDTKKFTAKNGLHGAAAPAPVGDRKIIRTPPMGKALRIPVPPGTVVRSKRSKTLLGDLVRPGQTLRVAEGGRGGLGAREAPKVQAPKAKRMVGDEPIVEVLEQEISATKGEAGEAQSLELLLRVVADVGIVGFPNAGKSSLLAAVTRAAPDIAPYPFTTLMPNLGVLGGDSLQPTVMADLPGLIEGAHMGRGLGRAFLRHLRRTRAMVVVVDASGEAPVGDYLSVREELRLYNPEYVLRPHVLAINKIDVDGVAERLPALREEFEAALRERAEVLGAPAAMVAVSAVSGEGLREMLQAVQAMLGQEEETESSRWEDAGGAEAWADVGEGGMADEAEEQPAQEAR